MKTRYLSFLTCLAFAALGLFGAGQAMAYTPAGTTITNTATLGYSVNGIEQDAIESNDGVPTEFLIDRLVRPIVTADTAGPVTVTPGDAALQTLTFTVTNDGNDILGETSKFILDAVLAAGGVAPEAIEYEVDGIPYTLGEAVEIASAGSVSVTVHARFPSTALDGEVAIYHLVATAVADDGSTPLGEVAPAGGNPGVVLGDAAGSEPGDGLRDGKHSDTAGYLVASAALAVTKSQQVIDDGGLGNTWFIPGATVRYTIEVSNNTGSVAASSVTLHDPIPVNTTYVAASLQAADSTTASYNVVENRIEVTYDSIPAGVTRTITFEVTID